MYKLPERFVSVTTRAYALPIDSGSAPPLSAFDVEDASVVRARVCTRERRRPVPELSDALVRARTSSAFQSIRRAVRDAAALLSE